MSLAGWRWIFGLIFGWRESIALSSFDSSSLRCDPSIILCKGCVKLVYVELFACPNPSEPLGFDLAKP